MYTLPELQQSRPFSQEHHDMEATSYDDVRDQYTPSVTNSRSNFTGDHFNLAGHIATYLVPTISYPTQAYSTQEALDSQQLYDSSFANHYLASQTDSWQAYLVNHPLTYSPHTSNREIQPHGHISTPSSYPSIAYPSKPSLSRAHSQSSLQSWYSENGSETNNAQNASVGMQQTPLTTIPMLPILVESDQPTEPTVTFRVDKKDIMPCPEKPDPYVAMFLNERLGEQKWHIFTSRLAENRKNGSRSRMKAALTAAIESGDKHFGDTFGGASAVDFLVKVEVVKGVLRSFVPHPYNPQKSLAHPYPESPKGHVIISRSSVLTLSGWSNTQFAYWARRAEGVSVLCNRDRRLRTVATVLEYRLKDAGAFECSPIVSIAQELPADSPFSTTPSIQSSDSSVFSAKITDNKFAEEIEAEPERWVKTFVTGKGLDIIIDEVKKRSGVSQFLRGKHSSLDPFGATVDCEDTSVPLRREAGPVFMPTFQAESYVHEVPSMAPATVDASPSAALTDLPAEAVGAMKRKASPDPDHMPGNEMQTAPLPSPPVDRSPPVTFATIPSSDAPQGLTAPSAYFPTGSSISPISPLSPITPLSLSATTASLPVVRQASPIMLVRQSPAIVHPSTHDSLPYDSPFDPVNAQLSIQGIHIDDCDFSLSHSQPISPISPRDVPGPSPDHYPISRDAFRDAREFELAQVRCAQSFHLSIPEAPERRLKKRKYCYQAGMVDTEPVTPKSTAVHLPDDEEQKPHVSDLLQGFYTCESADQEMGSSLATSASWHGHSAPG